MKYRGAIFDMDGLLFDTERIYQETWQELAEKYKVELGNNFLKDISGTNGRRMCDVIERYYHVSDGTVLMKECKNAMRRKLEAYVPIKEGVYEILQYFKNSHTRIAVASSSERQQIEANLENAKIITYFDEIVSGAEVPQGKPAPDIFLRAANKIGCRPEECYVFEDSENGVRAGYTAGCAVIMVPDLVEPSFKTQSCCTGIYKNLLQALEAIRQIRK